MSLEWYWSCVLWKNRKSLVFSTTMFQWLWRYHLRSWSVSMILKIICKKMKLLNDCEDHVRRWNVRFRKSLVSLDDGFERDDDVSTTIKIIWEKMKCLNDSKHHMRRWNDIFSQIFKFWEMLRKRKTYARERDGESFRFENLPWSVNCSENEVLYT